MHTKVNKLWHQFYRKEMNGLKLPEVSVYSLLEEATEKFPDHTAVIFEDTLIDYKALKKQVDKLAGSWRKIGFKKGERIGLMMSNHPLFIVSYYAAQALGLIVVQINPMYTLRELLYILNDTQVKYMVYDGQASRTIEEAQIEFQFKACMPIEDKKDGTKTIREMIESGKEIVHCEQINPYEDIAVIQYTGGTIGKVKGAMLTHHNLTSNVAQSIKMYADLLSRGKEIFSLITPLYHVIGMTTMNACFHFGGTILLFPKFDLQNVLENIKKYRATYFSGVPKIYNEFVNHPEIEKYELNSLKLCLSGTAPLPLETIKRFYELTGAHILESYGLSETSPLTHRNPISRGKAGSIGIPLPGTDCKIVDSKNNEVDVNETGELLIRGPQVMKGYWNNEEETELVLQNSWLHTGDLARMDEEGYFYIVGRKKEMIIVGGFNIYPLEVEEVLYEHPDIKEVAVVGIPHPEFGEMVKAFIVPKQGTSINVDDVKTYCYSKLTNYKVPRIFEVIEELPRNTVGKILKRELVKKELNKREANQ